MKKIIVKKRLVILAVLLGFALPIGSQEFHITQVDASGVLVSGTLDIYVDSGDGGALSQDELNSLQVIDAQAGNLEIVDIDQQLLVDQGISFLLMLDASGSMYDEYYNGRPRIEEATDALGSFISLTDSSGDASALALFNTGYTHIAGFRDDSRSLNRRLEAVVRPEREEAYTELYNSLAESVDEFQGISGRRAIILLSDGADYPFSQFEGGPNPYFGEQTTSPDEIIQSLQRSGITLYAVNFSDQADPSLARIATESGGALYEARSASQLEAVYQQIRSDILQELRVRVLAPAPQSSNRELELLSGNKRSSARYYLPLLFGEPGQDKGLWWLSPLLFIGGAIALAGTLMAYPFDRRLVQPELACIDNGATVMLQAEKTVIGSDKSAGLTLSGKSGADAQHATIVRGPKGDFTLQSKRTVFVNNNPAQKRKLKNGDVIRIEGATVVFQEPEPEEDKKR